MAVLLLSGLQMVLKACASTPLSSSTRREAAAR
jgi:hypothetical protein